MTDPITPTPEVHRHPRHEEFWAWYNGPQDEGCPGCGCVWHTLQPYDLDYGKYHATLIHMRNCPYMQWVKDEDEASELGVPS